MAYMSQEKKKALMPNIKAVLKKYNVKGSVRVINHAKIAVTLSSGAIDFKAPHGYEDVNHYYIHENYEGIAAQFLTELRDAMNVGNHNNSNSQFDYFDVGWYIGINIGCYNKHYIYTPTV